MDFKKWVYIVVHYIMRRWGVQSGVVAMLRTTCLGYLLAGPHDEVGHSHFQEADTHDCQTHDLCSQHCMGCRSTNF